MGWSEGHGLNVVDSWLWSMWPLDSEVETADKHKQANHSATHSKDHFVQFYGVLKIDLIVHFALTKRQF